MKYIQNCQREKWTQFHYWIAHRNGAEKLIWQVWKIMKKYLERKAFFASFSYMTISLIILDELVFFCGLTLLQKCIQMSFRSACFCGDQNGNDFFHMFNNRIITYLIPIYRNFIHYSLAFSISTKKAIFMSSSLFPLPPWGRCYMQHIQMLMGLYVYALIFSQKNTCSQMVPV